MQPVQVIDNPQTSALFRALMKENPPEMWANEIYTAIVSRHDDGWITRISIRRNDRSWPRDWRDFQRIKNEIAGVDVEAVELYPAEDRLVDSADQFHIWCLKPGERFAFGFDRRNVEPLGLANGQGGSQRPYDYFTCPRCGMTSHNPNDVAEGYCGNCHDHTGKTEASELLKILLTDGSVQEGDPLGLLGADE